jgi:hypothetical protein
MFFGCSLEKCLYTVVNKSATGITRRRERIFTVLQIKIKTCEFFYSGQMQKLIKCLIVPFDQIRRVFTVLHKYAKKVEFLNFFFISLIWPSIPVIF